MTWTPPKTWNTITTIDAHTGGEPLRIITGGLPEIPGKSVLEKRRYFRDHLDHIRTGLMWEPRGHADQYGAVLTTPTTPDGDLGTFFLHNEGYSTMCGHAIIAITKTVLDTGIIEKEGETPVLKLDTPAGRVVATAYRKNGTVEKVSFINVPSFVYKLDQTIEVSGIGTVEYDVAYGGAFYAFCNADKLGIGLKGKDQDQLVDWGRKIKYAVMDALPIHHPFEEDLSFLYGTIFIGKPENPAHHSRNVCIFAEGEVDRCPTGTGVSARAALHHARAELQPEKSIRIESILGTLFDVEIAELSRFGDYEAVIPKVTGTASIIGKNEFYFDPKDDLQKGFIFR